MTRRCRSGMWRAKWRCRPSINGLRAEKQSRKLLLPGAVVNRGDQDLLAAEAVEEDVGSAADDEFAHVGFGSAAVAEARLKS